MVSLFSLLPDSEIKEMKPVTPFINHMEDEEVISYGLGSYGYDIRIAKEFKVLDPDASSNIGPGVFSPVLDPKMGEEEFERAFKSVESDTVEIPPNSFILGRSVETFDMPDDVLGIALGKSTYARQGINVNITPIEPGWRGELTIEISNDTPFWAKVYGGEGIAQIIFFQGDQPSTTYDQRDGKYQNQEGVSVSKIKEG